MSVRLKLNHRRPEDCDYEALHARPIDSARVKRRPRPMQCDEALRGDPCAVVSKLLKLFLFLRFERGHDRCRS
jgi:hypothetical protein